MPRLGVTMVGTVLMSLRVVSKVGGGMLREGPGLPMVGGGLGGPMPIMPSRVKGLRGDMVGLVLREGGRQ